MGGRCLDREIVTVASHRIASHHIINACMHGRTCPPYTVGSGSSINRRQGRHRHHLSGIMGTRESGFHCTVGLSEGGSSAGEGRLFAHLGQPGRGEWSVFSFFLGGLTQRWHGQLFCFD